MHVLDPSEEHPSEPGRPPGERPGAERPAPDASPPGPDYQSLLTMVGAVEVTLADALEHLVEVAAETVAVAEGASLDVERTDGRRERSSTGELASRLQSLEDRSGEGPAADAAVRRRPVLSDDLAADPRWPGLAAAVSEVDARSVLVLPLLGPAAVLGVLTLSASAPAAFDDRTRQLGVRLAAAAARTVRHALVLDRARRLTTQRFLPAGDRATVDRAIRVLMTENGVGAEQAEAVLELLGRTEQEDLVEVARAIVAAEEVPPEVSPRG